MSPDLMQMHFCCSQCRCSTSGVSLHPKVYVKCILQVFHAGTKLSPTGELLADGGRVLSVSALGDSIQDAHDTAYKVID